MSVCCLERGRFPVPCDDCWRRLVASGSAIRATGRPMSSRGHCPSLLALKSFDSALVGRSCYHHDDSSQCSEIATVVKEMFLCVSLPAPRFSGKSQQIFPHSRLVRRNDDSREFVMDAQKALHLGMAAQSLDTPPDPPPLRTSVYSVSVVATPGSTPNSSSSALLGWSRTVANFASTSASSREAHRFWWECSSWLDRETDATDACTGSKHISRNSQHRRARTARCWSGSSSAHFEGGQPASKFRHVSEHCCLKFGLALTLRKRCGDPARRQTFRCLFRTSTGRLKPAGSSSAEPGGDNASLSSTTLHLSSHVAMRTNDGMRGRRPSDENPMVSLKTSETISSGLSRSAAISIMATAQESVRARRHRTPASPTPVQQPLSQALQKCLQPPL